MKSVYAKHTSTALYGMFRQPLRGSYVERLNTYVGSIAREPDCQIASNSDPHFASKNDPSDGAETSIEDAWATP
jgi:hypothetical protein